MPPLGTAPSGLSYEIYSLISLFTSLRRLYVLTAPPWCAYNPRGIIVPLGVAGTRCKKRIRLGGSTGCYCSHVFVSMFGNNCQFFSRNRSANVVHTASCRSTSFLPHSYSPLMVAGLTNLAVVLICCPHIPLKSTVAFPCSQSVRMICMENEPLTENVCGCSFLPDRLFS